MFHSEVIQFLAERDFIFKQIQKKIRVNDSTSIKIIAIKTSTMPLRTDIGMLVRSFEACNPKRMGIKVIKKPNVQHFNREITIS